LAVLASLLLAPSNVRASDSEELDYPLAVFNVASIQRLRDNAGTMFESAARGELTERVDEFMAGMLKETKGIDRNRPFGLMLYLNSTQLGVPLGIAYLPVLDRDDALETLGYGFATIIPEEGRPGRHVIHYNETFKVRTLHQNGYLFMVGPDGDDAALDRNFPDPDKMNARLSAEYDIAASLLIKTIPIGLKTTALLLFKNQAIASLQQRDDEPESVYRLRRANGEGWVDLIDKVMTQGEQATIGARMVGPDQQAYIDLEIAGTRDSKLAKLFENMAGKRTYFNNLLSNPSTFTMSSSWVLDEKQRKLMAMFFDAAERDLGIQIAKEELAGLPKLVSPIFKTFKTTADVGHLDAFAQMTGTEQGGFALLAGVKLANSRELPNQLTDILQFLIENPPSGNDLITQFELSFDAIDSFPVHRLSITPDEAGIRMFGTEPHLYVYATPQAVWVAFGGEAAYEALKSAIESVATPTDPKQSRNRIPFQFITHFKNWLTVTNENDPDAVRFTERANAAFESGDDAMKIEIRPTEHGVRVRTEFEPGFIGLMGRGFASGIDNGFFNRPPGGRRRNRNQENQPPAQPAPAQN